MKKHAFKRVMAALLAVTLIIGAIPIGAFAEGDTRREIPTRAIDEKSSTVIDPIHEGDAEITGANALGYLSPSIWVEPKGEAYYSIPDGKGGWKVLLDEPLSCKVTEIKFRALAITVPSTGSGMYLTDLPPITLDEKNRDRVFCKGIYKTEEEVKGNERHILFAFSGASGLAPVGATVLVATPDGKTYKATADATRQWSVTFDEKVYATSKSPILVSAEYPDLPRPSTDVCEVDPDPRPNPPRSIPSDVLDGCDGGFTISQPYEGNNVISGHGHPGKSAQVRLVGDENKVYKVTAKDDGTWAANLDEPIGENVTKIVVSVICTQDTGTQTDPEPKCYPQEEVDKLQKEIDDLKEKLDKCGANSEKLQEALDNAKKELADAKKLIEKKDKYLEELEKRVRELGKLAADLGKLRSKLEAKLHAAQDAIDQLKAEGEAKDAKIAELEKQLADAKAAIEKLEKALAESQADAQEKQKEIEALKEKLKKAEDSLATSEESRKKTEDALATSEESRKKTEGELEKTKQEKELAEQKIAELQKEIDDLKEKLDKCGANSEKLQEALDNAKKELADAKKLIEKKDKYIEELEKRVRELGKLAADLGKLRSKLEAKLHAAQDAIDELKAEGEAKDAKIAELEKQLADAKAAIEKLEKALADNKCETPEEIEKLKKEIDELKDKLKKAEDALATSEESRKKTEGELDKTKKEKELSDKEIERLKKELEEAKKSKDALMKEFQSLSKKYKEASDKGKESLKPLVSDAYKSLIPKTTKTERDNLVRSSFAGANGAASTPTIVSIPKAGVGL